MKRYFYITIHFSPDHEGTVFERYRDDLYRNTETGEIYRKRLLYDFGWGQEYGFELMPQLPFHDLIGLVERPMVLPQKRFWKRYTEEELERFSVWRSNLYGAVAVIMQDHVEELIDHLSVKVETDHFADPSIRENYKCFSFDAQRTRAECKIPGAVLTRSYEAILKTHPQWEKISSKVIQQVYGGEDPCKT